MTDSSMSTARANTVPYEAQGHLVAPSVSTHSKQNDTSIAQVMAQMQTMLTDALNRLEDVENRAERAAEAMEAATRERERLNSLPSVDQVRPSGYAYTRLTVSGPMSMWH
jgi:chemotaxis regulatin CheY-phosphate phosphatase CheZ